MENSLFLAVVLRETGETGKEFLARVHRVTEHHQETTNDTQVAEEEVEVEDEAITERLDDDDSEDDSEDDEEEIDLEKPRPKKAKKA